MYCGNCGTQRADDAKFCTNCGTAACTPAYQPPTYHPFPAQPQYINQSRPSDIWAWLVALSPVTVSLVWLVILLFVPSVSWLLWLVIGIDIGFRALDMQELKRHNIPTHGMLWGNWRPYLLIRKERVMGSSSALFVVQIIAFVLSAIFDIWMFVYFGIF